MKTEELMRKYFQNKDEKKRIKKERINYLSVNVCKDKGIGNSMSEEDCLQGNKMPDEYCETCARRHGYYLQLKKLSHANSGILIRIRGLLKKATA